jgi:hypothetical protein
MPCSRRQLLSGLAVLALCLAAARSASAQITLAPNLIYTSIQPCRVFDTRSSTGGKLVHGVTQTFNVVGNTTGVYFTNQGGHNGGCGIPGFDSSVLPQVQAVVFNFVAVGSAGPGDILGWPSDQAPPNSSIINYANSASLGFLNIANGIVVPVRQDSQGGDISLRAQVSDTDALADVVGYFSSSSPVQGAGVNNLFVGKGAGNPGTTTASYNAAFGLSALGADSTGSGNTAIGPNVLSLNSTGNFNTALGQNSLGLNTTGSLNVAVGENTLGLNTTASNNTAVGQAALTMSTTGATNAAFGQNALNSNTTGSSNTALGQNALPGNTTGATNVAIGTNAGAHIVAGHDNIHIAGDSTADESTTIRIGTQGLQTGTFVAGISGAPVGGGAMTVLVDGGGKLGTFVSSLRFKEDVQDMGEQTADLMKLRPVTFHYKPEYDDSSHLLQYGLIAEEVAQVYPDLVQYDKDGQPFTVRYHLVNAMLLNEVQKQHREIASLRAQVAGVEELRAELAAQKRLAADQEARIRRLEALIGRQP